MSPQIPLLPTAFGLMASAPQAVHNSGYQLPPAALQALVDAPRAPALSLSPRRDLAALIQTPPLPGIVEVAQPELKLAGERINPRTCAASRFSFGTGLALLDVANGHKMAIRGLPRGLRLADLSWSPDQRHLAFSHVAYSGDSGAVELWLVDIASRSAKKLSTRPLSTVLSRGFSWLPDSSGLLVQLRPAGLGKAPLPSTTPAGPLQQDTAPGAGVRQLRTYQDLLKNEDDARLFEFYITVQLALLDLGGRTRPIGQPDQYARVSVAPGGRYLLTHTVLRPYSYGAGVELRRAHRCARPVWKSDTHGRHAAAGRGSAAGERRGVGRRAPHRLAGRCAGHAGVDRGAGWRRPGRRLRHPRHRLPARRALPRRAAGAGVAGVALRRHRLGHGRGRAAARALVQDARRQAVEDRARPARAGARIDLRRLVRGPLQQPRFAGDARRRQRLPAPADRSRLDDLAGRRRRHGGRRASLHRPPESDHQTQGAAVPERRAVF